MTLLVANQNFAFLGHCEKDFLRAIDSHDFGRFSNFVWSLALAFRLVALVLVGVLTERPLLESPAWHSVDLVCLVGALLW